MLLDPYMEKVRIILDGEREGLHPLTPSVRSSWELVPFWGLPDPDAEQQNELTEEEIVDSNDDTGDA